MTCLDTSVLIALEQQQPGALRLLESRRSHGPLIVPAAVWMEYLAGISPESWPLAGDIVGRAASIVPFDEHHARAAARLQRACERIGIRRAWNDLQVAATAIEANVPVATLDQDYDDIPEIKVLHP